MEDLGLFREELTLYVHVNSCRTSAVAGEGGPRRAGDRHVTSNQVSWITRRRTTMYSIAFYRTTNQFTFSLYIRILHYTGSYETGHWIPLLEVLPRVQGRGFETP